ncbi:MAG TPA: hypothetical protein VEP90_14850 [Methylomirabilota bacterium]|nr:hypothetical protein [Methylomirabilota bacterium]
MAIGTNVRQEDIKKLEDCLLVFYPDEIVVHVVKSTKDVYEYRYILQEIKYTDVSFRHLLHIITNAVENNKRFRTYACIKLLRDILRTNSNIELEGDITDKLFYLFQHFVFSANSEVQRHANNLIRNRVLADEQIDWLIAHYKQSLHIVNRLLRYPHPNTKISAWAQEIYTNNELTDRTAEVLSIQISNNLSAVSPKEDSNNILWAIYYSKNTSDVKRRLLREVINENNLHQCVDSITSIAKRINCVGLIEELVKKYRKGLKNSDIILLIGHSVQ